MKFAHYKYEGNRKGRKLVTEPKMCFTHVHIHRNIKKWIDPINSNFKGKYIMLNPKTTPESCRSGLTSNSHNLSVGIYMHISKT